MSARVFLGKKLRPSTPKRFGSRRENDQKSPLTPRFASFRLPIDAVADHRRVSKLRTHCPGGPRIDELLPAGGKSKRVVGQRRMPLPTHDEIDLHTFRSGSSEHSHPRPTARS